MPEVIDRFEGPYGFLSNFYKRALEYKGMLFISVENAFQGEKENNTSTLQRFSLCPPNGVQILTPGEAKYIGRRLKLRDDWSSVKDEIMLNLIRRKFEDQDMKELLLATGDAHLIEGNDWHDNYWGKCMCPKCANIPGKNRLGNILMQVRSELRR